MDIRSLYRLLQVVLVLVVFATGSAGAQRAGATLRGTAFDAKTGEPLVGATVRVLGSDLGTAVGLNGSFVLHELPAGAATVQCQSVGSVPQQQQLTLVAGQTQTVAFRLTASSQTLGEVAVLGQVDRESDTGARRAEQKADNVLNIISAHTIELSPDITVGNVLQRASGVSVVRNSSGDGQYAIIRGMDRRYNYTLVNGIKIPSPDPKNRYVPLDIFPAELLERLEVVKALTPNMEGDAIGGAMNLVMKSAPDHLVVAATASTGYSDLFSTRRFSEFSTAGLATQSPGEKYGKDYVAKPSEFSSSPAMNYSPATPINALLGLTLGNRTRDGRFGVMVAGSYQRTYRGGNSLYYRPLGQPRPDPAPNTFTFDELQRREYSSLQTRSGLHAKLDYVFNAQNRLSLYSMGLQLDEDQHRHYTVNDLGLAGDVPTNDRSRFQRQRIFNETLQGDHTLTSHLSLNWSGVYSLATSQTPDQVDGGYVTATGANTAKGVFVTGLTHLWTHTRDQDWAGYLNLNYTVTPILDLSAGGLLRAKDRSNYYNYYNLGPLTNGTGDRQAFSSYAAAQYVFALDDGKEKTTDGNNYVATETITAGYVQAKLLLAEKLQIVGGVRAENTDQSYESQLPPTLEGRTGRLRYLDWLPSVHFKYLLDERQNLRLSYFKGISRPGYFELIPASFEGEYYPESGNFRLKHTQADNLDLRYEWFGPANAQLLGGLFYKHLVNPIEYGFARVGNNSFYYQPQNFGNATNYGAELVFIKYLRNWGLSGNYTYTHSSITTTKRVYYRSANGTIYNAAVDQPPTPEYPTPPTQTRPLQGQSDHIANLALLFRDETHGLHAQLAGVYTGRRINIVSPYKDLDQWQRATTQLDFSAEQRLPGGLTLFGKVTNLLNTPIIVEVMQAPNPALLTLPEQSRADRTLVQRDEFNRTYQLGLRYRLQ